LFYPREWLFDSSLVNKDCVSDSGRQNGNLEVNCGEKMEIADLGYLSTKSREVLRYSAGIKLKGACYVKTNRFG
jgi:hypothetical protein